MSAALFAPATMIRSSFEQRASSIIGSTMRSPTGARRDWTIIAPFTSTARPADRKESLSGSGKATMRARPRLPNPPLAAHAELENARHHNPALRPFPVPKHRKFPRLGAVHKHPAAKPALVRDDPVAAAVPADQKQGLCARRRGRLVV